MTGGDAGGDVGRDADGDAGEIYGVLVRLSW